MSKEKPLTPAEALRKQEKKEKKALKEKRSETDGVTKKSKKEKDPSSKKERKEKKDKPATEPLTTNDEPIAAAVEDVEMTTQLLNTLESEKPGTVVVKDETGDLEIKVKDKPLLGALVPFAVPLADEKVQKKVLKGVKKGLSFPSPLLLQSLYPLSPRHFMSTFQFQPEHADNTGKWIQRPATKPSNAASKKSSKPSANPQPPPPLLPQIPPTSSSWPPISHLWMSYPTSRFSAKITVSRMCLCRVGRSWAPRAARRDRLVS